MKLRIPELRNRAASVASVLGILACSAVTAVTTHEAVAAQEPAKRGATSYAPVAGTEAFAAVKARMEGEKPAIQARQRALLEERYDLSDRAAQAIKMTRGKAVQAGVRVKLPAGTTWEALAAMRPSEIRTKDLWPKG